MTDKNAETIFHQAISLAPDERAAFLKVACGDNRELQDQVQRLLEAHEDPDSYLNSPAETTSAIADSDRMTDVAAGTTIGNYKLLQKIGEGGFGVVYMAEQERPVRRKVALKIIKPGMDTAAVVARFEAERQALALMDHENIAKVFDGGAVSESNATGVGLDARPYFVMELVKGVPITDYCDQNNLATKERLHLFRSVCLAVQHAHQKGIIHRDIKPSNVMVTLHDGKPVVKVIDFGVAKAIHQRLTERTMFTEYGQMIGTPQYMSPEQAEMSGLDVDTRSDVYSLGVLLYELLTGSPPLMSHSLRAAGYAEIQRLIREQTPPKPSDRISTAGEQLTVIAQHRSVSPDRLHRELRGDLDWIVMKGLEKDRGRRYESALALSRDIDRMLNDQAVEAGPPTLSYRFKKFVQRNRRRLAAAAIAVLMVAAAVGWGIKSWNQKRSQQDSATAQLREAVRVLNRDLDRAKRAPVGDPLDWTRARSSRELVSQLLDLRLASPTAIGESREQLAAFDRANADRRLAVQIEEVVITSSAYDDLQNWLRMESEFHQLFLERGIDFETMTPQAIAAKIREDESAESLVDGLELWIGARGYLSSLGGPQATRERMQPMADAILAADSHPVRSGIRKMLYNPTSEKSEAAVDRIVAGHRLEDLSTRTLSWLATMYVVAGVPEKADRTFQVGLKRDPNDVMLNADYARFLNQTKKHDLAVRHYVRCTALRSDVSSLWRALGESLRKNNELKASRLALERAWDLDRDHLPTLGDLVETILLEKDFATAKKLAESAIELDGENPIGHACLGRSLLGMKRYAEAETVLKRGKALTKNRPMPNLQFDHWLEICRKAWEQQKDDSIQIDDSNSDGSNLDESNRDESEPGQSQSGDDQ